MGGSDINMPAAPQAPTASQTAAEYAKALPIYYQTAMQYEPQMAQLEKSINEQLYPGTAGLQEQMAGQASQGMGGMPDWARQSMSDQLKSQLGSNMVFNPLGQQQYGLGMMQANEDWKRYYQNMGLSLAGRQPLAQSSNMMQSYTPAANMGYAQQGYGTQANIYGQQSQNAYQQANQSSPWMNILGTLAGGFAGGIGTGVGYKMMK